MSMIKVAKPNNDDDSSGSDGQQKKKSESTSSSFRSNDETEPDDTGSTLSSDQRAEAGLTSSDSITKKKPSINRDPPNYLD